MSFEQPNPDSFSWHWRFSNHFTGSANKFRHKQLTKPPNILLYTGKDDVGDKKCSHLRACLQRILDKDSYALYRLKEEQVLSQPWPDNTALLVVAACSDISISTSQIFLSYLKQGGRVLSLCSGFHAELEKIFSSDSKELSIVSVETTAEVFDRVVLVDLICEPYFYKLTGMTVYGCKSALFSTLAA